MGKVERCQKWLIFKLLISFIAVGLAITTCSMFEVNYAHVEVAQSATRAQIEFLSEALDSYKKDVGQYPTTSEGLSALIINPGEKRWRGPYLKKSRLPNDAWGMPYQYQSPGAHDNFDLFSFGADKSLGGWG